MQVYVHSELYQAGITEDGEVYSAECYFVVVEDEVGRRKAHNFTFYGCLAQSDEEGFTVFHDVREKAKSEAERLRARVESALNQGHPLNVSHWRDLPHAYGSWAYINYGGNAEMRSWEKGLERG